MFDKFGDFGLKLYHEFKVESPGWFDKWFVPSISNFVFLKITSVNIPSLPSRKLSLFCEFLEFSSLTNVTTPHSCYFYEDDMGAITHRL